jgi:peptidoglycan hydrolase-like amidase
LALRARGYPFDLLDSTCDQVYKPNSAAPDTDAAIARTWSTQFLLDGKLIPLFYRSTADNCPAVPGCMGQIESRDRANIGENAQQILSYFYDPAQHKPSTEALPSRPSLPLAR